MGRPLPKQPEINIGTLGHVDNGKSTLVQAITGIWTARHSEELKRGITIKIGYADAAIYRCNYHEEPFNYMAQEFCPEHNTKNEFVRALSFIDCPGHHSLMITMLSGAALFDGALFVIDSRPKFPQLQDREHLQAAFLLGIKNFVFAQNKIDLVTKERAVENLGEIRGYLKESPAENAPVIPTSGQHNTNIDALLYAIQKYIPTPKKDLDKPFKMPILRSFDVNQPGTPADKIKGGIIGGSIVQGKVSVGDEIEIVPGMPKEGSSKPSYEPLYAEVVNIQAGGKNVNEARSGGLTGIETSLDPSLAKADGLTGNIAGRPGTLPQTWYSLTLEYQLFKNVIGLKGQVEVKPFVEREPLVINVYSAVSSGVVTRKGKEHVEVMLTRPVAALPGDRVTICRRIGEGWRLIGWGKIVG